MSNYKEQVALLRKGMERGDIPEVANMHDVSTQTVNNALRRESMEELTKKELLCMVSLTELVNQRQAAREKLERELNNVQA